jgi:hypothetical protein
LTTVVELLSTDVALAKQVRKRRKELPMNFGSTRSFQTSNQLAGDYESGMTPSDFFTQLRAVHTGYTWFVNKRGHICATVKAGARGHIFDPITAVAFAHTGEFYSERALPQAAASIGLSLEDCADFVSASNFDWDTCCRQGTIRNEILNTVGLAPDTTPDDPAAS